MTRWFTSDLHIGHQNIIEYCPDRQKLPGVLDAGGNFSVPAMTEALVRNWNEIVQPDDDVFIIGDLAMGKIEESLQHVTRLNGYKKLVPGNHDRCWSFAKNGTPEKRARWKKAYEDVGLEIWPEQVHLQLGNANTGRKVLVCHFPYRGDSHDEDRYQFARPFDEGEFLLCGHVHDSWLTDGKQINVGVDVWDYKPVDEAQLVHLIQEIEEGK